MSALMQERTYSLDEMAGAFLAIRNKISEVQRKADREIKVLEKQKNLIAAEFERVCDKDGVNSINTNSGTIIRSVRHKYWTSDWITFCALMKEHDAFDLVEQRIHQGNTRKFLEENPTIQPRNLNVESSYSITVRKPQK
jgi:hypothetical protein